MRPRGLMLAAIALALGCVVAGIVLFLQSRSSAPAPIAEMVAPAVPEPAPAPATAVDPVLDLFNPSPATLTEQLNDAALKNRLEELVVLAFVLRRCGYLSQAEYEESFAAYARYAQPSPTALSEAIASASASYSLLYGRAECDATQLPASAAQLAQWRRAVLNPPPR